MNWIKKTIITDTGQEVEAIAPYIISASRSTDIPAFYSKWFFNRLEKGYIAWTNPFNQQTQYVSLDETRFIVFWTKDPRPIMPYLKLLDEKKIGYYFQITLNDYEAESLEPNVPAVSDRISTFIELSNQIGKQRTVWRFDPLMHSNELSVDLLLVKIESIGSQIYRHTEKLVFSFADINIYRKVINNLGRLASSYREFNTADIEYFSKKLGVLNRKWSLKLATCAEEVPLEKFGIAKNRCIDDELISRISPSDKILGKFLRYDSSYSDLFSGTTDAARKLKDKGQRKACGCIISKDIGMYNTCSHLCAYCYANSSANLVQSNYKKHNDNAASII